MNVLITYDIDKRHSEVKQALLRMRFSDRWTSNNITYYLPNTTFWANLPTAEKGKELFHEAIAELNQGQTNENKIKIERFMAVVFTSWSGIPGIPHS
jgi:hypothetical protein